MDGKTKFRYVERCLYKYPENCIRLNTLRNALEELRASTSARGQGYEPIMGGGGPGDPVAMRVARIADIEGEIAGLEAITAPIAQIHRELGSEYILADSPKYGMRKILDLCYFGGNSGAQVAQILNTSERNVYKMRCRLVDMVIRCLGL